MRRRSTVAKTIEGAGSQFSLDSRTGITFSIRLRWTREVGLRMNGYEGECNVSMYSGDHMGCHIGVFGNIMGLGESVWV